MESISKLEKLTSLPHNADIDECAAGNPCDGICRNTVGSFECLCADGFQADADDDKCVDIDECLQDPCQGICINTQGSYSCSCELGYQLGDNGTCTGNLSKLNARSITRP